MRYIALLTILFFFGEVVYSQTTKDIEAVLTSQASAWNRGDIEGYMQGYWKSDSLLFTSGGKIQHGWAATLEKYKKSYTGREKMGTLRFSDLQISVLSGSSAWVFGRWELTRAGDHPEGVFTLVMKKFPEGWRIVHDHTSIQNGKGKGKKGK